MGSDPGANGVTLIGLDPGFAAIGYAVCVCDRTTEGQRRFRVLRMGLIRTEKSDKKREIRAADDNVRRAREITVAMDRLFRTGATQEGVALPIPPVRAVCAEAMSFPRNASNAAKIAMCWGVISALIHTRELSIVQASPQEVKQALCSRKDASKAEIREAVESRFGADLSGRIYDADGRVLTRKDRFEHPYDALASAVACLKSEVVQALWR